MRVLSAHFRMAEPSSNAPAAAAPPRGGFPVGVLYVVFCLSGLAAILYQLIWQRALFALLGIDSVSVSLIVAAFLLGLGLGALAGGALSKKLHRLPLLFAGLELGIGAFGLVSLPFFRWMAGWSIGAEGLTVGLVAFAAVIIPTLLMGATLPVLVAHTVRASGNVGRSVGALYFVNTIGSAAGCALAGGFLFGALGMSGSVYVAAALNALVAIVVLAMNAAARRGERA